MTATPPKERRARSIASLKARGGRVLHCLLSPDATKALAVISTVTKCDDTASVCWALESMSKIIISRRASGRSIDL